MNSSELHELVRAIVTVVLDDDAVTPTWSVGSAQYYAEIASHLCSEDPQMCRAIEQLVARIRTGYRSFPEYQARTQLVTKTRACELDETDVCCICLQKFHDHWKRTVRFRAASDDPTSCGHRIHLYCARDMKPNDQGCFTCPLCRENLGPYIRHWNDTESKIPQY